MKQFLSFAICFLCIVPAFAQQKPYNIGVDLGFGLGIDYGGIGARLSILPVKQVKVFGALGYNLAGLGYSIGGAFRILPEKRTCPYISGMYGHNSVVIVFVDGDYRKELTESFTGPTFGLGIEQRGSPEDKNYFDFELLVPIRSENFKNYKAYLEDHMGGTFISIPIALSIGYHIQF